MKFTNWKYSPRVLFLYLCSDKNLLSKGQTFLKIRYRTPLCFITSPLCVKCSRAFSGLTKRGYCVHGGIFGSLRERLRSSQYESDPKRTCRSRLEFVSHFGVFYALKSFCSLHGVKRFEDVLIDLFFKTGAKF